MRQILILTIAFSLLYINSFTQAGDLDMSFNPNDIGFGYGDGADFPVYTSLQQANGKIIISGSFSTIHGIQQNRMARLNVDGSLDTSFIYGSGISGSIHSMEQQNDGKILVAGNISEYDGIPVNNFFRISEEGVIDTSFHVGTGFNGTVYQSLVQNDGKIIVIGSFSEIDGNACNRIVRLDQYGSIDTLFNTGWGPSMDINYARAQSDGRIIIGGQFLSFNNIPVNRLARLNMDGSVDTSFVSLSGQVENINKVEVLSNDKFIITGLFKNNNNEYEYRVLRLNPEGTIDSTFFQNSSPLPENYGITLLSSEKILVYGNITEYLGIPYNGLLRLNENGSIDTTFYPVTGQIYDPYSRTIHTVTEQSDGKIFLGGNFSKFNTSVKNKIARILPHGELDTLYNTAFGLNNQVTSMILQPDGKILVAGRFNGYFGETVSRLIRLNQDGSRDTSFIPESLPYQDIFAIDIQDDNKILVGGGWSYVSTYKTNMVRLHPDGSLDTTFVVMEMNYLILSISYQDDGKIIIGGNFAAYDGFQINRITRLNSDGTSDVSFNTSGFGTNDRVLATTVLNDEKILIAGAFTKYNNFSINRIARLDSFGNLDNSFDPGDGANDLIADINVLQDGKIVIVGNFTKYGSTNIKRVVRINPDGSIDPTFNSFTGANDLVSVVAVQSDGKIILGGDFSQVNGVSANHIVRLNPDGSIDASFEYGQGTNESVVDIDIQEDNDIIISGKFTSYRQAGRNRIARITSDVGFYHSEMIEICNGETLLWHNSEYSVPGLYYDSMLCVNGLDSVYELNLMFAEIDLTLVSSGVTITSLAFADSYQWLDCEDFYSPITGANGQYYTASTDGSYAVEITKGLCIDTTECYPITSFGIRNALHTQFNIYPNPFTQELILESSSADGKVTFAVLNLLGEKLLFGKFQDQTHISANHLIPGLYFVRVEQEGALVIKKIVKQ